MRITIPGAGDGQGGLACRSPQSRKESDTTEQLSWWWSTALRGAVSQARSRRAFPAFVPTAKGGSNNHLTLKGTKDRKGPATSPTARRACVCPFMGSRHPPSYQAYHLQASAPASHGVVQGEVVGVGRRVSVLACLTRSASKYQPHHGIQGPPSPP